MDCTNKNCPAYAKCLASYRGSLCKAIRATYGLGDHITEYDRLVRKSPEEMSEFIEKLTKGLIVPPGCPKAGCKSEYCQKCWLDWLKQEAGE